MKLLDTTRKDTVYLKVTLNRQAHIRLTTSEEARTTPFPPYGAPIKRSPSSSFLATLLRWALLGVRGAYCVICLRSQKLLENT